MSDALRPEPFVSFVFSVVRGLAETPIATSGRGIHDRKPFVSFVPSVVPALAEPPTASSSPAPRPPSCPLW